MRYIVRFEREVIEQVSVTIEAASEDEAVDIALETAFQDGPLEWERISSHEDVQSVTEDTRG